MSIERLDMPATDDADVKCKVTLLLLHTVEMNSTALLNAARLSVNSIFLI